MCEWQRLRTRLNHDWLKNEYLKNLDSLILQLQVSPRTDERLQRYLNEYIKDWPEKHKKIEQLLDTAENELSPCNLFSEYPLERVPSKHKEWLRPLTHAIWLNRHMVKDTIQEAQNILSNADNYHYLLKNMYYNVEFFGEVEFLESFADTLLKLSKVISRFPDKTVV